MMNDITVIKCNVVCSGLYKQPFGVLLVCLLRDVKDAPVMTWCDKTGMCYFVYIESVDDHQRLSV